MKDSILNMILSGLELYKNNHPQEWEKVNSLQTKKLLQRKIMR